MRVETSPQQSGIAPALLLILHQSTGPPHTLRTQDIPTQSLEAESNLQPRGCTQPFLGRQQFEDADSHLNHRLTVVLQ